MEFVVSRRLTWIRDAETIGDVWGVVAWADAGHFVGCGVVQHALLVPRWLAGNATPRN